MSSFFDLKLPPKHYARELLHNTGSNQIPIPVDEICFNLGIKCIYHSGLETEAVIIKSNSPKIVIKQNSEYRTRNRFSIAHGLGHYCIPDHLEEIYKCTVEDFNNYSPNKLAEKEANLFVAELLIPLKMFTNDLIRYELSMENIITLANKYDTSIISTAIRFVKNTEDVGAIVLSQNGEIKWSISSKYFFEMVRTNGKLSEYSVAFKYFSEGKRLIGTPEKVLAISWSEQMEHDELIIEETLSMGNIGYALAVIKPLINNEEDLFYIINLQVYA